MGHSLERMGGEIQGGMLLGMNRVGDESGAVNIILFNFIKFYSAASPSMPRTTSSSAAPFQLPQRNVQRIDRTLNRRILAVIANLPLKHPLTRLNLRRNDIARNRHGILLRHPILRPTQQHITALPPLKPPQETSVFGKKRQIHIIFAAKPRAKRRRQHIPESRKYARWNAPATAPPSCAPAPPPASPAPYADNCLGW